MKQLETSSCVCLLSGWHSRHLQRVNNPAHFSCCAQHWPDPQEKQPLGRALLLQRVSDRTARTSDQSLVSSNCRVLTRNVKCLAFLNDEIRERLFWNFYSQQVFINNHLSIFSLVHKAVQWKGFKGHGAALNTGSKIIIQCFYHKRELCGINCISSDIGPPKCVLMNYNL